MRAALVVVILRRWDERCVKSNNRLVCRAVSGYRGVGVDMGLRNELWLVGGASEAFIVALEPDDTYRWSRSWENVESGVAQAVGLDGDQMLHGQINFYGQIDADAGMGMKPFAANGDQDVLLQRLRPGSGGW